MNAPYDGPPLDEEHARDLVFCREMHRQADERTAMARRLVALGLRVYTMEPDSTLAWSRPGWGTKQKPEFIAFGWQGPVICCNNIACSPVQLGDGRGVLAVHVDGARGAAALRKLEACGFAFPDTTAFTSPLTTLYAPGTPDGRLLIYALPKEPLERRRRTLGPGLAILGYYDDIPGPRSEIDGVRVRFLREIPPVDAPAWLQERAKIPDRDPTPTPDPAREMRTEFDAILDACDVLFGPCKDPRHWIGAMPPGAEIRVRVEKKAGVR